jgi:putative ABC transport system permease protein
VGAPFVVLLNETAARTFWPRENPIGKRVKYGGYGPQTPWREVVGVVADTKLDSMEAKAPLQVYEPFGQTREDWAAGVGRNLYFVARTVGDPAAVASSLRMAVHSLDKTLPVSEMRTMQETVNRSTQPRRFNTYLMGLFAGIALLLAAVGIYGLMAYSVTVKTQEIGIRMALGAARQDVLIMVVRQALKIAGAGIAIGLPASLALTQLMAGLLYGVKASDPLTFVAASLFLGAVAVAATVYPAFRATRIDPANALRSD